jgi:hypothetical protein
MLTETTSLIIIRMSLSACLLLYGCDRSKLVDIGLILNSEVENLPSRYAYCDTHYTIVELHFTRRKLNNRGSVDQDPIMVDSKIVIALEHYVATENEDLSCLVLKFLHLLFANCTFLESHEIDNFILRNSVVLYKW